MTIRNFISFESALSDNKASDEHVYTDMPPGKALMITIAEGLKKKIKKTGILILSGLLIVDETDIIDIYTGIGFQLQEKSTMDEWISLVFHYD